MTDDPDDRVAKPSRQRPMLTIDAWWRNWSFMLAQTLSQLVSTTKATLESRITIAGEFEGIVRTAYSTTEG